MQEDELCDVYNIAKKKCPIEFVAPVNGIYTFETFGSVKNEFVNDSAEVMYKADGINQKLVVELKKGEVFVFDTENVSNKNGVYQIKVEFTPTEIMMGETKAVSVKAGETEYVAFYNDNGVGFNYSIEKGEYMVTVMLNNRTNILNNLSFENKTQCAIAEGAKGKYLISINNYSNSDAVVDVLITTTLTITSGQADEKSLGHKVLYQIEPLTATGIYNVETTSSAPIKLNLFDENYKLVKASEICSSPTIQSILEESKPYYILIESANVDNVDVALSLNTNVTKLVLGQNKINKEYSSMTYELQLFDSAEVLLNSSDSLIELTMYDSEWNLIDQQNGKYAIDSKNLYYVVARGDLNEFSISVSIEYTENLSGYFGNNGYRYIKFIPNKSDFYNISGVEEYNWFDNLLRPYSGKLYAGDSYYLKIDGISNAAYDINITRNAVAINLRSNMSLTSGLYSIEIMEIGIYTISTTKANNVIAIYDIIDSKNNTISSNISVGERYNQHFDVGMYFIEIISEDSIGVLINKLNADNSNLNNTLINGIEHAVIFNINTDNNFEFTAPSTGEYYFKIAYASTSVSFDIMVADSNLKRIDIEELQLKSFANDTLNKRYGLKMYLDANITYYINIYYNQANAGSMSAEVLMSLPSIIKDVYLCATDFADDITIIKDRYALSNISVSMGRSYEISTPNADKVKWQISSSTREGVCSISGNKLIINLNSIFENLSIGLVFIDDKDEMLTVNLTVKFPYYAKPYYDSNKWEYGIEVIDRTGNLQDSSSFKKMNVNIGNQSKTSEDRTYCILPLIISNKNILSFSMTINSEVTMIANGREYTISAPQVSAQHYMVTLDSVGSVLQGSGSIIVDARVASSGNKEISVPTDIKSMILVGNRNQISNVKFKFQVNAEFTLLLFDYSVKVDGGAGIDLYSVDNSKLILAGENRITGYSSNYLLRAKNVEFIGDGKLDVIGDNGVNGNNGSNLGANGSSTGSDGANGGDGTSGTNGTGALYCSSVAKSGSAVIKLQGGNGGNGGDGRNGGNGGNGGSGGNGGDRGVGCSLEISISGITVLNGYAGCGGNGGFGGNGGMGANSKSSSDKLTKSSIGGNGGNGGNAGKCGSGDHVCKKPIGGFGGNGGAGGAGNYYISSPPGALTITYIYEEACIGGNGGNGGKGYIGGNGGKGGNGGNGSKGGNAIMFTAADDGRPGARGGNGGKGGNYTSSSGKAGEGGLGGIGGTGGKGGDKFAAFKAGKPGEDGKDGDKGADGTYDNPSSGGLCIALGTLITLADGRQVPVESLIGNEMLLVWNLFTGKFDVAPILFIDNDPAKEYEVINLYFSDGTSVKVIDEHGFWDYDLNKYVFLRKDASQYIGHWFNKQTTGANGNLVNARVQLVKVVVQTEYTSAWSPVTYGHLCYYVNGMLSMPGATTGLINIFDVDPKTMKIDEAKYLADIEEYGLFTFEEFASICSISEEVFEAFGGKYLKVAIGKGLTSIEELETLIARYSQFWE